MMRYGSLSLIDMNNSSQSSYFDKAIVEASREIENLVKTDACFSEIEAAQARLRSCIKGKREHLHDSAVPLYQCHS